MRRGFWRVAKIGALVLAMSIGTMAQTSKQLLTGLINDYTPGSVAPVGPWEVHGDWSLTLNKGTGKGDFTASLTMERSDYWVVTLGDPDDPSGRSPHTHHISLANGVVTPIPGGFRVSGTATVAASGNPASFGEFSSLQIDITGGTLVTFSNVALTFGDPASGHFGVQPVEGVVLHTK
jgi:hypothetical protein